MLNMLKASLGIGAAKVDTVLESLSVVQGGVLKGNVVINVVGKVFHLSQAVIKR
jgi:sporulation-control protein spo0M